MDRPELRGIDLIAVAQDLNPCTFDTVKCQTVPVMMVGDEAQAIYSFRGSANALTLFNAEERLPLTRVFGSGAGLPNWPMPRSAISSLASINRW